MIPLTHKDSIKGYGGITYRIKEKVKGWGRLIFSDKNSRNLFLFLILNFSFAFVELTYGVWTNSLGEYTNCRSSGAVVMKLVNSFLQV